MRIRAPWLILKVGEDFTRIVPYSGLFNAAGPYQAKAPWRFMSPPRSLSRYPSICSRLAVLWVILFQFELLTRASAADHPLRAMRRHGVTASTHRSWSVSRLVDFVCSLFVCHCNLSIQLPCDDAQQ